MQITGCIWCGSPLYTPASTALGRDIATSTGFLKPYFRPTSSFFQEYWGLLLLAETFSMRAERVEANIQGRES